jgi:hypothetical protein
MQPTKLQQEILDSTTPQLTIVQVGRGAGATVGLAMKINATFRNTMGGDVVVLVDSQEEINRFKDIIYNKLNSKDPTIHQDRTNNTLCCINTKNTVHFILVEDTKVLRYIKPVLCVVDTIEHKSMGIGITGLLLNAYQVVISTNSVCPTYMYEYKNTGIETSIILGGYEDNPHLDRTYVNIIEELGLAKQYQRKHLT